MNGWFFIVAILGLTAFFHYATEFSRSAETDASARLRAAGSALHAVIGVTICILVLMGVRQIWTDDFARDWGIYFVYGGAAATCSYYWNASFSGGFLKDIPVIGRALLSFHQTLVSRRLDHIRNEAARLEELAARLSAA